MNIYFDTEFTGLHKNTTLISIGCVDEKGRKFYAEFSDFDYSQCNDWIKENVIAHLNNDSFGVGAKNKITSEASDGSIELFGNREFVKEHLSKWLSKYDKVQFVSDVCHYDMVLLIDLFGTAFDLPNGVSASCHDVNQDIARHYGISESEAFDMSREGILADYDLAINGEKHNALYDARVIKRLYAITRD